MKKRIVTLTLALAMVMATTLTACQEWAAAIGLPPHQTDHVGVQSTNPSGPVDVPTAAPSDPVDVPTATPSSSIDMPTASPSGSVDVPPSQTPGTGLSADVTLIADEHIAYIQSDGSGLFSPNKYITRAEAAVILRRLLSDTVPVTVSYSDVPADSPYADAAAQLGSLGVIRPTESTFNGDESISRREFAGYIACFFPLRTDAEQFSDVLPDDPYGPAILSGRAWGWLTGRSDGTFNPDGALHRYEAVVILNRALGRSGDRESIEADRPALFLDVPVTKWYYYDVMEAAVPHTPAADDTGAEKWTDFAPADTGLPEDFRTEGVHLYNGWSYYYSAETKDILRSRANGGNTYDIDGHFTTGDATVDAQLRDIVLSKTKSGMTGEEMLQALYAYCRDTYKYLKWNVFATGDTSFTLDAARQMLSTGRGNCYCYASVFWYLARWIGYDARIYSGTLLGDYHSWVEINGYIYDTQMEWRWVHERSNTRYLWYFYQLKDSSDTWRYRK